MTAEHQQQQEQQHHTSKVNDTVLIVGAGIAGMMLALLLQKAGIPYDIYERAAEVKALGTIFFPLAPPFSYFPAPLLFRIED